MTPLKCGHFPLAELKLWSKVERSQSRCPEEKARGREAGWSPVMSCYTKICSRVMNLAFPNVVSTELQIC